MGKWKWGGLERGKGRMMVAKFHGGTHAGRERSMFLCLFVCLDADVLIDVGIQMCGCVDVQMFKRVGVWMWLGQSSDVWMRVCVCGYVWICGCGFVDADVQV